MKKRDIWLIGLLLAAALMLYLGAQTLDQFISKCLMEIASKTKEI